MATFTETEISYISSLDDCVVIENSVTGIYDLGSGYNIDIQMVRSGNKIKIEREFNGSNDLSKMPDDVVTKYAKAINEITQWENDELPDFPDLKAL